MGSYDSRSAVLSFKERMFSRIKSHLPVRRFAQSAAFFRVDGSTRRIKRLAVGTMFSPKPL